MANLVIKLAISYDKDPEPEYTAPPVKIKLSDKAAQLLGQGITLSDMFDVVPGDGDLDVVQRLGVPIRLPIVGTRRLEFDALLSVDVE